MPLTPSGTTSCTIDTPISPGGLATLLSATVTVSGIDLTAYHHDRGTSLSPIDTFMASPISRLEHQLCTGTNFATRTSNEFKLKIMKLTKVDDSGEEQKFDGGEVVAEMGSVCYISAEEMKGTERREVLIFQTQSG